jgi:DNA-directed RNA polymerase I subunit RPA1
MASRQALIWQTKFHLLDSGHVQAALSLDHDLAQAMHRASSGDDTSDNKSKGKLMHTGELAATVDAVLQERLKLRPIPNHVDTSFERETRRLWTKEALAHCMGAKKCQNCDAVSPKIRHDAYNKIFQTALADANQRSNDAAGIVFLPASSSSNGSDSDDDDDDEPKPDGYASDDSQAEEGKDDDDDTMSDMEDEEGKDKDALGFTKGREATAVANRKKVTIANDATTKQKSGPDKFFQALEVEAQVRAVYRMEPSLCRSLFGSSPNHYFLRAIPVPPARFRPPMVMGTMTVEHAQNFYLQKVIQCNERVRTLMAHIQAGVMVSPNPNITETTKMTKADRNKSQAMAISTWIDLQTHVNCFMDSSKDPSASSSEMVPNGIRQLLEKKEGIFRKYVSLFLSFRFTSSIVTCCIPPSYASLILYLFCCFFWYGTFFVGI